MARVVLPLSALPLLTTTTFDKSASHKCTGPREAIQIASECVNLYADGVVNAVAADTSKDHRMMVVFQRDLNLIPVAGIREKRVKGKARCYSPRVGGGRGREVHDNKSKQANFPEGERVTCFWKKKWKGTGNERTRQEKIDNDEVSRRRPGFFRDAFRSGITKLFQHVRELC